MQVTLQDLLAEIRNLSYLFYGYTVIWVIILGYLFTLSRREQNLRNEIEELKQSTVNSELGRTTSASTVNADEPRSRQR